jgi:hypothetical protein
MSRRRHPLAASTALFVGYTGVMLSIERRLRRTGGPGIIAFELAGNASRAEALAAAAATQLATSGPGGNGDRDRQTDGRWRAGTRRRRRLVGA